MLLDNRNIKIINSSFMSFLVTLLVFYFLSKSFTFVLISIDDATYQNYFSGAITGVPDAHCIFIQYPLAWIISRFYILIPNISWYKYFLEFFLFLCFFCVFKRINEINLNYKKIISFIILIIVFSSHIIHPEWTVISGLLGSTAIFRFITFKNDLSVKESTKEYIFCSFLLFLCYELRNSVAFLILPIFIFSVIQKNKISLNNKILFFCFIFLILLSSYIFNYIHYYEPDWEKYYQLTDGRSDIHDYYGFPEYEKNKDIFIKSGITKEMYDLMKDDFNYIIPCNNMENIKLRNIADVSKKNYYSNFSFNEKINSIYKTIINILHERKYFSINIIIIFLIIGNITSNKKKGKNIFYFLTIFWTVSISLYLIYKGRFPERVVRCIAYCLISYFGGELFVKNKKSNSNSFKEFIMNIFCIVLVFLLIKHFDYIKMENNEQICLAQSKYELTNYCELNPTNVYFYDFCSFSQRGELFFHKEYNVDNYLFTNGWPYCSPQCDKLLERKDCSNIDKAIKDNHNIYYLVNSDRTEQVLQRLNSYYYFKNPNIKVIIYDTFSTNLDTVNVLKFIYTQ